MLKNPFTEISADGKSKRQQLDHLLRITAPHERFILAGIGLLLLAFASWALFGSVTRSVVLDGVLLQAGARHEVVTAEPGYLLELLVMPGDRIEAGMPIARQSVPRLERELAALRERIHMLEEEARDTGVDKDALDQLLVPVRTTLLELEARRDARELITSHTGGMLARLRASPGDYLPAGASVALVRESDNGSLQAALHAPHELAPRVHALMPALVEVALPDGATLRLDGEVASVSAGPAPRWLQELLPTAVGSVNRVDITLRRAEGLSVPDGTPCRVRIILGRHPPAALLHSGWSRINPSRAEEQG